MYGRDTEKISTYKNEVWIPHHWCNVWHYESSNYTKIGVVDTSQCHILHHVFYSAAMKKELTNNQGYFT